MSYAPFVVLPGLMVLVGVAPSGGLVGGPDPAGIVGGDEVPEGEHPEVVELSVAHDGGTALCTGTLLTPSLVLTAAHCFDHDGVDPASVSVARPQDSDPTFADDLEVHPDYCRVSTDHHCEFMAAHRHDLNDFAWVHLAESLAIDDANLPTFITDQARYHDTLHTGATVTLLGFGRDEQGNRGTLREVEATVGSFSPDGLDFHIDATGGHDACKGDSGGPALIERDDGTWALAGVLSRGPSECGTEEQSSIYGVPLPVLHWVSEASGQDVLPTACADEPWDVAPCLDITPGPDDDTDRLDCAVHDPRDRSLAGPLLLCLLLLSRRRQG